MGLTSYSLMNMWSWRTEMRRSVSLNSYGMFQPIGPKVRRSWMTAWKKHRPYSSFLKAACNTTPTHALTQYQHSRQKDVMPTLKSNASVFNFISGRSVTSTCIQYQRVFNFFFFFWLALKRQLVYGRRGE